MQQRETPDEQHVILDGFYRWTDIKYGWPSVLTPTEVSSVLAHSKKNERHLTSCRTRQAAAIKSLTSLEALTHPEHPLRERESQGITLYLGEPSVFRSLDKDDV